MSLSLSPRERKHQTCYKILKASLLVEINSKWTRFNRHRVFQNWKSISLIKTKHVYIASGKVSCVSQTFVNSYYGSTKSWNSLWLNHGRNGLWFISSLTNNGTESFGSNIFKMADRSEDKLNGLQSYLTYSL